MRVQHMLLHARAAIRTTLIVRSTRGILATLPLRNFVYLHFLRFLSSRLVSAGEPSCAMCDELVSCRCWRMGAIMTGDSWFVPGGLASISGSPGVLVVVVGRENGRFMYVPLVASRWHPHSPMAPLVRVVGEESHVRMGAGTRSMSREGQDRRGSPRSLVAMLSAKPPGWLDVGLASHDAALDAVARCSWGFASRRKCGGGVARASGGPWVPARSV